MPDEITVLKVVDRAFLKTERHLTDAFIKRHGRDMGGIGKPMIWDLELVDLFLRERMWADRLKQEELDEKTQRVKEQMGQIVRRARTAVVTPIGEGREMQGRGGRGRAA